MIEKLISESVIDELDQIGSDFSRMEKRTMEITHDLITWLEGKKSDIVTGHSALQPRQADQILACGRMDVYRFVADRINRSSATVRNWYRVREFIGCQMWAEAYDVLPFSHLYEATKYTGREDKALRISLEYLRSKGRPPSVDYIARVMTAVLSSPEMETAIDTILTEPEITSFDDPPCPDSGTRITERIILSELRRVIYAAINGLDRESELYPLVLKLYDALNLNKYEKRSK